MINHDWDSVSTDAPLKDATDPWDAVSTPQPPASPQRQSFSPDTLMTARQDTEVTSSRLPGQGAAGFSPVPFLRKASPFLGITLLLALIGIVVFENVNPQVVHVIVTKSPATATAQSAATPTAPVVSTTTSQQQIYTQATSGTPVIDDPLSDDRNNWGVFTTSWGGQCAFTGGAYHLTLSQVGYVLFCNCANLANLNNFNNYALQVQLRIEQGNEGGVVFDQTASGAYRIDISSVGTFILYHHTPSLVTLQNSSSPAIKTGLNQTNVLTLVINNGNLYFYVNSQFVTSYNFGANSTGGGDLAAQSDAQPTDVAFSNLKIWTF